MHCTMMPATEWDREFIADLATERTGLGESEVVGVRWLAAADQTRLLGDTAQMLPVAIAPRGSDREDALVDALRWTRVDAFGDGSHLRCRNLKHRRIVVRESRSFGRWELREPPFKSVLHELGIGCCEAILGGEYLTRPGRGEISRCDVPKLGQQLFALRGRLLRGEDCGDLALAAATAMTIAERSRRHPRLAVRRLERAVDRRRQQRGWSITEIRRIKVIFTGDANEREQGVPASVRQRGAHALGVGDLGDRTHRPIRSDPLARGVGERGGQMEHAGALIDGGRL